MTKSKIVKSTRSAAQAMAWFLCERTVTSIGDQQMCSERYFELSNRDHLEIFLARAAFRAGPVHRHVVPAGAGGDAFVRQACGFVVDPATNQAHPGLVFGRGGCCRYCSRLTALQVKCKVGYLNLVPVQNQTSPLILSFNVADPVGAIGIQADLASFAAMGCHGLSVITAILVGDTARVEDMRRHRRRLGVRPGAGACSKTCRWPHSRSVTLGSIENVSAIAEIVSDYPDIPLVLDPFISAAARSRRRQRRHAGRDARTAGSADHAAAALRRRTGAAGRDLARTERPRHADRRRRCI